MAGFSDVTELSIVDHALGTSAWTMPTGSFVQLHTADPTETGGIAVAANSTRKSVTWNAASSGSATNSNDLDWTTGEVTTTENYTYFTLWTASTAGVCIGMGTLTGGSVTAGNAFTIPAGDLTFSLD